MRSVGTGGFAVTAGHDGSYWSVRCHGGRAPLAGAVERVVVASLHAAIVMPFTSPSDGASTALTWAMHAKAEAGANVSTRWVSSRESP